MYKPGDLKTVLCGYDPEDRSEYDARGDRAEYPLVKLPHSCDSWIIGGPDQIKMLMADLGYALEVIEPAAADTVAPDGEKGKP